jgi:site-specific recombinase XerD
LVSIKNPNFLKYHNDFVEELRSKGRSEATIIAYAKDIEQLLVYLGQKGMNEISKVTITELENFKESMNSTGYTPKSVSRKINSTRTFFRHLLENQIISENPAEKLAHPSFEMKPPRVLTIMEYRALRDVSRVDVRLYSIIELLLQTGIRIGELASLTLDDIRESKDAKITYLYIKPLGNHSARKVPLNKSAYNAIQEYLKIRPETEDDALFITKNGRPLLVRNIRTTIDKAFEKAGIKSAKVNDLRNTFIAHHLANGVSLVTVSKLVGHKRLSTTEKYLNLINKDSKEETAKKLKDL